MKGRRDYDGENISNAHARQQANVAGLRVVTPKPNELQIDIDSFHQMAVFGRNRIILERYLRIKECFIWPSPSGEEGHFHVRVVLEKPITSPLERIALQAILGSDPVRELFSYARWKRGDQEPTILFEKRRK